MDDENNAYQDAARLNRRTVLAAGGASSLAALALAAGRAQAQQAQGGERLESPDPDDPLSADAARSLDSGLRGYFGNRRNVGPFKRPLRTSRQSATFIRSRWRDCRRIASKITSPALKPKPVGLLSELSPRARSRMTMPRPVSLIFWH